MYPGNQPLACSGAAAAAAGAAAALAVVPWADPLVPNTIQLTIDALDVGTVGHPGQVDHCSGLLPCCCCWPSWQWLVVGREKLARQITFPSVFGESQTDTQVRQLVTLELCFLALLSHTSGQRWW